MKSTIRDWLIIFASLLDDVAVALFILLILWLLKIPISLPIILFIVLFFVTSVVVMHMLVMPALRRKKTTGAEGMIGLEGKVVDALKPKGLVTVQGELWEARSVSGDIAVGTTVEIVGLEGLTLMVKPKRVT